MVLNVILSGFMVQPDAALHYSKLTHFPFLPLPCPRCPAYSSPRASPHMLLPCPAAPILCCPCPVSPSTDHCPLPGPLSQSPGMSQRSSAARPAHQCLLVTSPATPAALPTPLPPRSSLSHNRSAGLLPTNPRDASLTRVCVPSQMMYDISAPVRPIVGSGGSRWEVAAALEKL